MRWMAVLCCAAALLTAAESPFTEKELALGKVLAREIEKDHRPLRDPAAQASLARVGNKLAGGVDPMRPWVFTVLEDRGTVAAALPGGRVYVSAGVLSAARTEAEVAAVLAHLMAHIDARHGRSEGSAGPIVNYAGVPLIYAGGWTGVCAIGAPNVALPVSWREKTAEWEKEANDMGREYLRRAAYDPDALSEILGRLRPASGR